MTFTGWNPSLENVEGLMADAQPYECVFGSGPPAHLPHPKTFMKTENQGRRPSCVGHGGSSLAEYITYLATNGRVLEQLNRMFCWTQSQKAGGSRPSESAGASIYGCAKVLCEMGLPPEDVYPYSNAFRSEFPPEVFEAALATRCKYKYELNTVEKVKNFHDNHMGGILWGVLWKFQRGAWHCVTSIGDTLNHLPVFNSHGENDGDKGWYEWDDETIERHLGTSGAVAIGISDLAEPQVRNMTWDDGGLVV